MHKSVSNNEIGARWPTPDALVLFVTGRCNARCGHCFYAEQLNKDDDGIDGIALSKVLRSLTRSTAITLTGGEPFIRSDISQTLGQIADTPLVHSISVNSNGFLPARTAAVLTDTLAHTRKPIRIQLSLDGQQGTHDAIRGVPGGYVRTLQTARWLTEQAQRFPSLSMTLSITVMRSNIDQIEPLVGDLLAQGFRTKITFVRGNSFSTFNVPDRLLDPGYEPQELPAPTPALRALVRRLDRRFPGFFDEYAKRKLEAALYTLENRQRQVPCLAGDRDGVIYHDGRVGICEQVIAFGHLSNWDWDLDAAWNSPEAASQRALLRQCACIHGCNLSTGVAALMAGEAAVDVGT